MKNAMTLDGYVYTPIYHQPTTMNTMCVYRIQKADEEPMYFLASCEMNEWFIKKSTFNQMKTHVMPQHYEGFFKDEFSAILMAKNIAMDSCIERQKSAFKKAQEVLEKAVEDIEKVKSTFSLEDIYDQYYDSQEELRRAALKREKEAENK